MILFCRGSMRSACNMLTTISLNNRDVYEEEFEQPFLKQTSEYYKVSFIIFQPYFVTLLACFLCTKHNFLCLLLKHIFVAFLTVLFEQCKLNNFITLTKQDEQLNFIVVLRLKVKS